MQSSKNNDYKDNEATVQKALELMQHEKGRTQNESLALILTKQHNAFGKREYTQIIVYIIS